MLCNAGFPDRDLELATYLSRLHGKTRHHMSSSECESMSLAELLRLADPQDHERWTNLRLEYTDPLGAPWLREAAASAYQRVSADELVCFAGAQEALYATLHALLRAGDHAIIVVPSYQSMETLALSLCDVSGVALDPADNWSLDVNAVAAALRPNTRMVVISFPNNPTGKQLEQDRFDALPTLCRNRGIWLLSDEVYRLTERDRCAGCRTRPTPTSAASPPACCQRLTACPDCASAGSPARTAGCCTGWQRCGNISPRATPGRARYSGPLR